MAGPQQRSVERYCTRIGPVVGCFARRREIFLGTLLRRHSIQRAGRCTDLQQQSEQDLMIMLVIPSLTPRSLCHHIEG